MPLPTVAAKRLPVTKAWNFAAMCATLAVTMADQEITLGMVMEHLRAMEGRINTRFDAIDKRLDELEARIERVHRSLTAQIDAIDKRLDTIEIETLPNRVERIEQHLQLSPAK